MKEISAGFLRLEINRLGALVVETGLYHPSGTKLHSAGEPITLAQARSLHESVMTKLFLLEFGEDERTARRSLGVEHVLAANVVAGDQLPEDIRTPGGELLLAAGTTLDEPMLDRIRSASVLAVPVRHRKLAALTKQAEEYLAKNPASGPGLKEAVTRVTRITSTASAAVRYLLIPRARVLVGIADDLLRTLIVNALVSEGHEPVERKSAAAAVHDAHAERPHIILLDLLEGLPLLAKLRGEEGVRNVAVMIVAEPDKGAQIHNALYSGANGWIPRPPSRDALNDNIKGCQDLLLRHVQLARSLKNERRKHLRQPAKMECSMKDPTGGKPPPVTTAEIVDTSEGGVRLAYNVPRGSLPWAYMPHGVHPRHPFYAYATSIPGGQELRVTFAGPRGVPVEKAARIAHIAPAVNNIEVLGLAFPPPAENRRPASTTREF